MDVLNILSVPQGTSRLSKDEHSGAMARLRSERERRAKMFPDYRRLREDLSRSLTLKARDRDTERSPTPERSGRPKRPPDGTSDPPPRPVARPLGRRCANVPR